MAKTNVMHEVAMSALQVDYRNPNLSVADRVKDLLGRMTLEEKVAQMVCIWRQREKIFIGASSELDEENLKTLHGNGLGQIARISDLAGGLTAHESAALANRLQKFFVEKTRLGIPVLFHEECLHGLTTKDSVSFPQPIGLASTFNPELIEQIYSTIAKDARSRGVHLALTPVVDIARDPRWGRVEETFGEDPYLVSQLGIAAIKGFQGDGAFKNKTRVMATLKHFAAHGEPESGSNCGPGNISERVLRDFYLYPFKQVLDKSNPAAVMASYNEIDGLPSHANSWLLRDVLRDEWGFKGIVVSDYFAITELHHKEDSVSQSLAGNKAEAACLAARAGVNIELPDADCYPYLIQMVQEGKLPESIIEALVADLLKYKFMMGLFEDPYVDADELRKDLDSDQYRALSLRAARETITLLKNDDHLLPLSPTGDKTIAVIGPNADRRLLGGYSGKPQQYTTILQGIRSRVSGGTTVLFSEGCKITVGGSWDEDVVTLPDRQENELLIAEAVATARKADIVVLALGDNEQTSREAWGKTHLGDRTNLDLFGQQNELVQAIVATGKPMVAVLINGRPISVTELDRHAAAILECWYLGQETGTAVAQVLFGDHNPSGKLPISIPRSVGHIPCFYNYKPSARRGYLFDDITPLYPFGFGKSYTSFAIKNIRLEKTTIKINETTHVAAEVTNTGDRCGEEVVQMYIHDCCSSVTRPVKELRGFQKVKLQPGETRTIKLIILPEHLAFTNVDKKHVVEPGDFEIMVGDSSRDEDLTRVTLQVI